MSRQLRKGLSVKINDITEDSFIADGDIFVKDNLAINASGIAMRNNPKTFNLEYEELEFGETIGRGCSSVVLHGIHVPTGTQLALKVINMFDKSKRDQLIREIRSLYDAQCSRYCSALLLLNYPPSPLFVDPATIHTNQFIIVSSFSCAHTSRYYQ